MSLLSFSSRRRRSSRLAEFASLRREFLWRCGSFSTSLFGAFGQRLVVANVLCVEAVLMTFDVVSVVAFTVSVSLMLLLFVVAVVVVVLVCCWSDSRSFRR